MRKTVAYLVLALVTSLASCSSSDDANTIDNGGNSTSGSYWPLAVGNKWEYNNVKTLGDTLVHHIHKTVNYEGKTYFQVEPLNASDGMEALGGSREERGVFYEYHEAVAQMGTEVSAGTMKSIDTNLAIGQEWTDELTLRVSAGFVNGTIKHINRGKILEQAAKVSVNGKTYKNILKVELTKTIENSINEGSYVIKYEDWLAKGLGPVYRKTTYYFGTDQEVEEYNLFDYTVK